MLISLDVSLVGAGVLLFDDAHEVTTLSRTIRPNPSLASVTAVPITQAARIRSQIVEQSRRAIRCAKQRRIAG